MCRCVYANEQYYGTLWTNKWKKTAVPVSVFLEVLSKVRTQARAMWTRTWEKQRVHEHLCICIRAERRHCVSFYCAYWATEQKRTDVAISVCSGGWVWCDSIPATVSTVTGATVKQFLLFLVVYSKRVCFCLERRCSSVAPTIYQSLHVPKKMWLTSLARTYSKHARFLERHDWSKAPENKKRTRSKRA